MQIANLARLDVDGPAGLPAGVLFEDVDRLGDRDPRTFGDDGTLAAAEFVDLAAPPFVRCHVPYGTTASICPRLCA